MTRKVIVAGLLAGLVVMVWMFVVNGILGFNSRINLKRIADERGVYETLQRSITEPGRYVCNPEVDPSRGFPANEPVFSILYGGMGHEAAGKNMLIQLPFFFVAPLLAAWMLSATSTKILASGLRRVAFVTCIGLIIGITSHLGSYGIGGYPLGDTMALAAHDIVLWALIGAVLAWRIRPETEASPHS